MAAKEDVDGVGRAETLRVGRWQLGLSADSARGTWRVFWVAEGAWNPADQNRDLAGPNSSMLGGDARFQVLGAEGRLGLEEEMREASEAEGVAVIDVQAIAR